MYILSTAHRTVTERSLSSYVLGVGGAQTIQTSYQDLVVLQRYRLAAQITNWSLIDIYMYTCTSYRSKLQPHDSNTHN